MEVWREQENELDIIVESCVPGETRVLQHTPELSLVSWLTIYLLRFQGHHYVSDAAIQCLLQFIGVFFTVLGQFFDIALNIAKQLPRSLYAIYCYIGYNDTFQKFVVMFNLRCCV